MQVVGLGTSRATPSLTHATLPFIHARQTPSLPHVTPPPTPPPQPPSLHLLEQLVRALARGVLDPQGGSQGRHTDVDERRHQRVHRLVPPAVRLSHHHLESRWELKGGGKGGGRAGSLKAHAPSHHSLPSLYDPLAAGRLQNERKRWMP